MKRLEFARVRSVLIKLLASIFVCLVAVLVPTAIISGKNVLAEKFRHVASYQGILELWNIDTFEGGTASKKSFLTRRAIEFQKQNKGTLVMVKNMTADECLLALGQGQKPDMFSFGHAFAGKIKECLSLIECESEIDETVLQSATTNNGLLAVGYARSAYLLASEQNRLADLSQKISNQAFVCGKVKQLKNGKKQITYSLVCGLASTNSQRAFEENFYPFVAGETTINYDAQKTSYQAYCDFVEGKANILLGTIRDLVRIKNRESQCKLSDVVFEPFGGYTDLVQYLGICKDILAEKQAACKTFINFLVCRESQSKLAEIGLLSVCETLNLYEEGVLFEVEKNSKNYYVPNMFE